MRISSECASRSSRWNIFLQINFYQLKYLIENSKGYIKVKKPVKTWYFVKVDTFTNELLAFEESPFQQEYDMGYRNYEVIFPIKNKKWNIKKFKICWKSNAFVVAVYYQTFFSCTILCFQTFVRRESGKWPGSFSSAPTIFSR